MTPDDVLAALDPEQRDAASAVRGPVCILAGAGTGKTRTITHRAAYAVLTGAVQPSALLAVTFTARAAGEMRTRLRDLGAGGVQARTFHAAALRQLHYFWPQAIGGAAPEIMSHKAPAVAQAAASLRLQFDRTGIRDLAAEVEWAKVNMLTPETYAAAPSPARQPKTRRSDREFPPSRFEPCMPPATSPAAYSPVTMLSSVSASTSTPPIT